MRPFRLWLADSMQHVDVEATDMAAAVVAVETGSGGRLVSFGTSMDGGRNA